MGGADDRMVLRGWVEREGEGWVVDGRKEYHVSGLSFGAWHDHSSRRGD